LKLGGGRGGGGDGGRGGGGDGGVLKGAGGGGGDGVAGWGGEGGGAAKRTMLKGLRGGEVGGGLGA
jgi:hypothetical protein